MLDLTQIPIPLREQAVKAILRHNLALSFGPPLVDFMVDSVLLGVMLYLFTRWLCFSSTTEKPWLKYLIWYLVLMSVAISAFILYFMMELYVYGFGTYLQFASQDILSYWYILHSMVFFPVSAFYGHRAYHLTGHSKIFAMCFLLTSLSCVGSAIAIKVVTGDTSSSDLYKLAENLTEVWLATGMATDVLVTGAIMFNLLRSRTGWSHTDRLINRLVFLAAETQLPPTLLATIYLIISSVNSSSPGLPFFFCISKVYVVGILVVLNARYTLRQKMLSDPVIENSFQGSRKINLGQDTVYVRTETFTLASEATPYVMNHMKSINRVPVPTPIEEGAEEEEEDGAQGILDFLRDDPDNGDASSRTSLTGGKNRQSTFMSR